MDQNSPDIFRELRSNSWHFAGFPADGDGIMCSRLSHWCSKNDQKSEFERRLDCLYLPRNPSGESSYSHSPLPWKYLGVIYAMYFIQAHTGWFKNPKYNFWIRIPKKDQKALEKADIQVMSMSLTLDRLQYG